MRICGTIASMSRPTPRGKKPTQLAREESALPPPSPTSKTTTRTDSRRPRVPLALTLIRMRDIRIQPIGSQGSFSPKSSPSFSGPPTPQYKFSRRSASALMTSRSQSARRAAWGFFHHKLPQIHRPSPQPRCLLAHPPRAARGAGPGSIKGSGPRGIDKMTTTTTIYRTSRAKMALVSAHAPTLTIERNQRSCNTHALSAKGLRTASTAASGSFVPRLRSRACRSSSKGLPRRPPPHSRLAKLTSPQKTHPPLPPATAPAPRLHLPEMPRRVRQ